MQKSILNIDSEIVARPKNPELGKIYLANDSNFVQAFFSQPLTEFAGGFSDAEGLLSLLEFVAPSVPVDGARFEYKACNSADSLGTDDTDDVRGVGHEFKAVQFGGTNELGQAPNKGLTVRLDRDMIGSNPAIRQRVVGQLLARLFRNDIRRAISALSEEATSTAKTWDTTAGLDPDADLITEIEAAAADVGLPLNRVLYGGTAWKKRFLCNSNKESAAAIAGRLMSPEQLALIFQVDAVHVSRERYSTGTGASVKSEIVGSNVFLFNALANATTQDASNIKRFVVSFDDGKLYRVYEHEVTPALTDISVEHYSDVIVTSTLGIRKLAIN